MANGYVCHILHNTGVVIEWTSLLVCIGAFHLVRTHLGGGGVKPPIHFHCVLHAEMGWVGLDSM